MQIEYEKVVAENGRILHKLDMRKCSLEKYDDPTFANIIIGQTGDIIWVIVAHRQRKLPRL